MPFSAPAAPAPAPGGAPGAARPAPPQGAPARPLGLQPRSAVGSGALCSHMQALPRYYLRRGMRLQADPTRRCPTRPLLARPPAACHRQVPCPAQVCSTVGRRPPAWSRFVPHVATHTHVRIVLEAAWEKQTSLVPDSSERTQVINGVQTSA